MSASQCADCGSSRLDVRARPMPWRAVLRLVAFLLEWDRARALGRHGRALYRNAATFEGAVCLDCGSGLARARMGPHTIILLRSGGRDSVEIDGDPAWSRAR